MKQKSRMYPDVKTWSPYKGCLFGCVYCGPSFQRQAKRQMHICNLCYLYEPHEHPERLNKFPSANIIFVAGNGDISYADPYFTFKIIKTIHKHNIRCPHKEYYFQSKRPAYFKRFIKQFPDNVILLTTLETNRDKGYKKISKAPVPSKRYKQFLRLDYPRKVLTIEPIMDFDLDVFLNWIVDLKPEFVWLGYNSRPKQINLPEPNEEKMRKLIKGLRRNNIRIREKDLRGLKID